MPRPSAPSPSSSDASLLSTTRQHQHRRYYGYSRRTWFLLALVSVFVGGPVLRTSTLLFSSTAGTQQQEAEAGLLFAPIPSSDGRTGGDPAASKEQEQQQQQQQRARQEKNTEILGGKDRDLHAKPKPKHNLHLVIPPAEPTGAVAVPPLPKDSSAPKTKKTKKEERVQKKVEAPVKKEGTAAAAAVTQIVKSLSSNVSAATAPPPAPRADTQALAGSHGSGGCFKRNSKKWLEGPRHGNRNYVNESDVDESTFDYGAYDAFARAMTLDMGGVGLLGADLFGGGIGGGIAENNAYAAQSICPAPSKFRNLSDYDPAIAWNATAADSATIRSWRFRLVYLSAMYHQHYHANAEAVDRYTSGGDPSGDGDVGCGKLDDELQRHRIGRFDYECPESKFLVVSLAGVGIGINIRGAAVRAMLAGLASNRTVLIVSGGPSKSPGELPKPWPLASCQRQDYQCFFMSPTPCVLSDEDLVNAYPLPKKDIKNLVKWGVAPKGNATDKKVWYMPTGFTPQEVPKAAKQTLYRHSMAMINELPLADQRIPTLKKAAESILEPEVSSTHLPVALALTVYFLRPNLHYAKKVNEIFNEISHGVDPQHSIGLMIRASDKCGHESECLSFSDHMKAISTLVKKDRRFRFADDNDQDHQHLLSTNFTTDPTAIVFTTESKSMVKEQEDFIAMNKMAIHEIAPFSFRVASNTADVHPDTGAALNKKQQRDTPPDEVMLSAVSTLKFQLLPSVTVGNCCSNFHKMLIELLSTGCGAAPTSHFHCMKNNEDPRLRMCCTWQKACKEEKRLAIEQYEKNATFSLTKATNFSAEAR